MPTEHTATGDAATSVILSIFRVNGLLLEAGDRLSAGHGLTSARWQVLGAIALSDRPLTVPQIARRMGLTRQSVHATVDRLVRDGLIEQIPNDGHRRSQLVRLTALGLDVYGALDRDQAVWVRELTRGIRRSDLEAAGRILEELIRRLETARTDDRPSPRTRVEAGREGR
jgi:DNA-binding MarR family transcriptional regulator